jgi:hypothetical protein
MTMQTHYNSIDFRRFGAPPSVGFSIPARRAEFCWTPSFLRDCTNPGEFEVLKRLDLRCRDFSMTWGASFTYWRHLSDVDLLAEVLAVGIFAIVESEVPADRVLGALLRVPEVRRCARGNYDAFTNASRVNGVLSAALQTIILDGLPASQFVASLQRDTAARKWMDCHPNYLRV